jgi:two-component system cell cycle sensor histidine kinase/response regulator CckA
VGSERARSPGTDGPATCGAAPGESSPQWRGHGTVLVVDDDSGVREVMRALLERRGFTVLTAADGRSALDIFHRCADEIRLIVLDLMLPDTDGEAVFRIMRQVRPSVRAILCSGCLADEDVSQRTSAGWAAIIRKPFRVIPFLQTVHTVLEG